MTELDEIEQYIHYKLVDTNRVNTLTTSQQIRDLYTVLLRITAEIRNRVPL